MQESQGSPTRKKFLLWSAVLLSSATIFKFFSTSKSPKKDTVKMLTEDGTLVEIERDRIPGSKKRNISDPELKAWVKK